MLPKRDWQKPSVLNLLFSSLFDVLSYNIVLWDVSYTVVIEICDCLIMSTMFKHLIYMHLYVLLV